MQKGNREVKHEKIINTMKINYNQALIDLSNRKNEIFMLKKGSGQTNVKDEARKEERRHESRKHMKKEWREKLNVPKSVKNLNKCLIDEMKSMKKEEAKHDERERKKKRNGRSLILH